jgi:TerC family integral membrane protein
MLTRMARTGYGSHRGYIVEASLSLDNRLVFVIIMAAFAVPREHQQRVLIFGIITALALRAIFIALGATLLSLLSFMFLIFGLLLLWTAVRLYRHRDQEPDIRNNALVRLSRRILPVSDAYTGGRLISRSGGRRVVTPLFIVFITIGGTDLLFAMDSIPAVFGVTDQPYIVFAANAFALLGLRALFFLVTGLLDRLVYLSGGLAVILAFIGVMPAAARPAASAMDSQIVTLVASISGPRCNGSGLASHLAPRVGAGYFRW